MILSSIYISNYFPSGVPICQGSPQCESQQCNHTVQRTTQAEGLHPPNLLPVKAKTDGALTKALETEQHQHYYKSKSLNKACLRTDSSCQPRAPVAGCGLCPTSHSLPTALPAALPVPGLSKYSSRRGQGEAASLLTH